MNASLDPTPSTHLARKTLLFSDIEGSTQLVAQLDAAYGPALQRYQAIVRDNLAQFGGLEDGTQGDSFLALFEDPGDALGAAITIQRTLQDENWPNGADLRARMGLHDGALQSFGSQLVGFDLHLGARIASAAHGGQILMSRSTFRALTGGHFDQWGVAARPLGQHLLKDIRYPEALFDIADPELDLTFPPVRTAGTRKTNITSQRGPIVGRDDEVASIRDLLRTHPGRLITVTGAGGMGKTSVAERVAALEIENFDGGTFFVDLSGLDDADLVFASVAREMRVRDFPGRPIEIDVANAIAGDRTLLILDTFEHVTDAAIAVGNLLSECPKLRVIVTSRVALNITAEKTLALTPLTLPSADADDAATSSAMALFLDLAAAASDFAPTDANRATIAAIVRKLEGIPLALNLAAARLAMLTPDQLLERLDSRLKILSTSRPDAGRHQTLRQAIDWSDGLLTESERRSHQRLAVFAGGFQLDDAESFLAKVRVEVDVLDTVDSLSRQNLIHRRILNGVPRFGMYDMIREFALDKLRDAGDLDAALAAYADHVVETCESHAKHALNEDQRDHVQRLGDEVVNIRTVLRLCLDGEQISGVSRIIKALYWYWISQGIFTEALRWIDEAVALADRLGGCAHAGGIHMAAAYVKAMAGDYGGAYPHGRDAEALFDAAGDVDAKHQAALIHAICGAASGRIEDPSEALMTCISYMQERGDTYFHSLALIIMGEGARMEGDRSDAEDCYVSALALLAEERNSFWPGLLNQNLGHFRLAVGDANDAAALFCKAYDLGHAYDYPIVLNLCVAGFGGIAIARGEAETAARFLGAVAANMARIGAAFEPTDRADIDGYVAAAKDALGGAYDAAAAQGAAATWDDLRAEARAYASA